MDTKMINNLIIKADKGDAQAQYQLACEYKTGDNIGYYHIPKMIDYFTKAAEQGHLQAQEELADIYLASCYGKYDFEKAFYWASKAAEQNSADKMTFVGLCYSDGVFGEDNKQKGKELIAKAKTVGAEQVKAMLSLAQQGDKDAQFFVGNYYCFGISSVEDRDYAKGLYWLNKADQNGHPKAKRKIYIASNDIFNNLVADLFCTKVTLRDVSQDAFLADEQLQQRVFKMCFDRLLKDFVCIDKQFKDSLADAPWSQLQSLRNKLTHCGMSANEVYLFAKQELDSIYEQMDKALPKNCNDYTFFQKF